MENGLLSGESIYFIIADCIYMFSIRIYFSCRLHHIKLLFVIKMSRHHANKIIKFHYFTSINYYFSISLTYILLCFSYILN